MRRSAIGLVILGLVALGIATGPSRAGASGLGSAQVTATSSVVSPSVARVEGPQPIAPAATTPVSLPGGIKAWWMILGLAAAVAFAIAIKRLPDQVLHSAGTSCRLKE